MRLPISVLLQATLFPCVLLAQQKSVGSQRQELSAGFFNSNVRVYETDSGTMDPIEIGRRLIVVNNTHQVTLRQLNGLVGSVHINDASEALQYVRLRTSPSTWYLWHDGQRVEIVRSGVALQIPQYGLGRSNHHPQHGSSGYMGVLSDSAFKQGKFAAANVSAVGKSFVVKRWLLTGSKSDRKVSLVKEVVGRSGEYECTTLEIKHAPKLPGTSWYIAEFQ